MLKIVKKTGLHGDLTIPGDKSISHRSIMLGAISKGITTVRGFLKSADCLATMECFRRMGITIEEIPASDFFPDAAAGETILRIHGNGLRGLSAPSDDRDLDACNSGTTVRLLSGILAGQNFDSRLTGDSSLKKRPMGRIIRPLSAMGISVTSDSDNDRLPLTIHGGHPKAVPYESAIASAQVKSCVLFAGLYADGPVRYTEPALSRNHTELMLEAFGAKLEVQKHEGTDAVTTVLYPGNTLKGQTVSVPGDISSAAYFLAAGLLVPDSEITLRHVGINETRDGMLRVIRAMGGNLSLSSVHYEGRELTADLTVSTSALHGTEIGGSIIPTLIDELPVIAVMAAAAEGDTVIRDAGELRVKESDRLAAITENLRLMGINVDETADGMVIHGGSLHGASIDPLGDHRLAMAFSIAGLVSSTPVIIENESCVDISYPTFYSDLASLG